MLKRVRWALVAAGLVLVLGALFGCTADETARPLECVDLCGVELAPCVCVSGYENEHPLSYLIEGDCCCCVDTRTEEER